MRTRPVVASPNTFLDISLRSNFTSPERISEVGVLGASNTLKIFFSRRSCKASCRLITSFPSELGSIGAVIGCMILLFHLLILSLPIDLSRHSALLPFYSFQYPQQGRFCIG